MGLNRGSFNPIFGSDKLKEENTLGNRCLTVLQVSKFLTFFTGLVARFDDVDQQTC